VSDVSVNVAERLSGTVFDASTAVVYGRPRVLEAVVMDSAEIVLQ
jgi:hypothetical protein